MKKILVLLLACAMMFSFAACNNEQEPQSTEQAVEAPTAKATLDKVLVIQRIFSSLLLTKMVIYVCLSLKMAIHKIKPTLNMTCIKMIMI